MNWLSKAVWVFMKSTLPECPVRIVTAPVAGVLAATLLVVLAAVAAALLAAVLVLTAALVAAVLAEVAALVAVALVVAATIVAAVLAVVTTLVTAVLIVPRRRRAATSPTGHRQCRISPISCAGYRFDVSLRSLSLS